METIWRLFEGAVARHAARPAVVDGPRRVSYAELDGRVRALAAGLAASGVQRGDRVAVLDVNSTAFLTATFAVAGLGAVLQPLNHRLAPRELDRILADAESRVLFAGRSLGDLVGRLGAGAPPVLWAEDEPASAAGFAPSEVAADDLAQLYYTSGTTGRPKGVMLTHENVCVHAHAAIEELGLSSADRWGHFVPMFHLADAWACLAITAVGGTHVIEPRFDAERALERIEVDGVTLTNLIPTMLTAMVASPRARSFEPRELRMMLSGGAPIAPALVRRVIETFRCEYVQTYGMTETSPYLTLSLLHDHLKELSPDEALRYRARTGRPFVAVELEVVDGEGGRVPADDHTVGEIRVRGRTVSPGYWRRPEETAAAFRDGWLHTGDLAVVDAEGYVDIVARKKDVIVTGGENVYSIEVENVLHEHPAVLEAAVFGVPDAHWGEAVRAAVVLRPGLRASAAELIDFCRERIAGYKVPGAVELRDELPKTGSGKVARRRLREEAAAEVGPGRRGTSGA